LNIKFHPFVAPTLLCRFVLFLAGIGSHGRPNHPRQILSLLIQGFGATGAQNLGFPIDFDSRPCNSVTHYRATLHVIGKNAINSWENNIVLLILFCLCAERALQQIYVICALRAVG